MSASTKPELRLPRESDIPADLRAARCWAAMKYTQYGRGWRLDLVGRGYLTFAEVMAAAEAKKADALQLNLPDKVAAIAVKPNLDYREWIERLHNAVDRGDTIRLSGPDELEIYIGRSSVAVRDGEDKDVILFSPGSAVIVARPNDWGDEPQTAGDKLGSIDTAMAVAYSHFGRKWIQPTAIGDLASRKRGPAWLVKDRLERGVLAIFYGPAGTLKTCGTNNWAVQAATAGHPVVLLYGEGWGLANRLQAHMKHNAPDVDLAALPILPIEARLDLGDPGDMTALHDTIEGWGKRPALIVVDTISKYAGALDENSPAAVKAFLGILDRELRGRYGATVLLVGHTPHSNSERIRGATNWYADTDAAYGVSRVGDRCTVTRSRFKDSPELPPLTYRAVQVTLDHLDESGQPVTSLALEPCEPAATTPATPKTSRARKVGAAEAKYRGVLHRLAGAEGVVDEEQLTAELRTAGVSRQAARKIRDRLEEVGTLTNAGGKLTFAGAAP